MTMLDDLVGTAGVTNNRHGICRIPNNLITTQTKMRRTPHGGGIQRAKGGARRCNVMKGWRCGVKM
jgi:hypothetical protein